MLLDFFFLDCRIGIQKKEEGGLDLENFDCCRKKQKQKKKKKKINILEFG